MQLYGNLTSPHEATLTLYVHFVQLSAIQYNEGDLPLLLLPQMD